MTEFTNIAALETAYAKLQDRFTAKVAATDVRMQERLGGDDDILAVYQREAAKKSPSDAGHESALSALRNYLDGKFSALDQGVIDIIRESLHGAEIEEHQFQQFVSKTNQARQSPLQSV